MSKEKRARPFLKWAGGKTQLLPQLLARAPKTFGRYIEPFVGGGALFFALQPKAAILCDANRELIRAYEGVRDCVESVIDKLEAYALDHSPELFDRVRRESWSDMSPASSAARTIYLNKTCFNGLYRVNAAGQFNVALGKFKTPPTICDADNLRACSAALHGVELHAWDFCETVTVAREGNFVYLDPPYLPSSSTANFTSYTSDGFGLLADEAARLKARGVHVLLSSSGDSTMRKIYEWAGLRVEVIEARRRISCKGDRRNNVQEFLVS